MLSATTKVWWRPLSTLASCVAAAGSAGARGACCDGFWVGGGGRAAAAAVRREERGGRTDRGAWARGRARRGMSESGERTMRWLLLTSAILMGARGERERGAMERRTGREREETQHSPLLLVPPLRDRRRPLLGLCAAEAGRPRVRTPIECHAPAPNGK